MTTEPVSVALSDALNFHDVPVTIPMLPAALGVMPAAIHGTIHGIRVRA
jgi:hypothetical protein